MYENYLIFGLLLFIIISNYFVLKFGDDHYTSNNSCTLFDIFHKILPDLHEYHFLTDIYILIGAASLFMLSNEKITVEFISKFIIIMFIRAFTTFVTILPKHDSCNSEMNLRSYIMGGCYDKIFSGHTSFILLLTLLYFREHIIGFTPLILINLVNILTILAARSHYSVDILLAIFVTTTVYSIKL